MQGAWKKPFTGRADLVIAVGFRFWSGEKFGQPPTWTDKATYVQIDATPARIGWQVPAEVALVGDPKLVLRQLIEAVKARKKDFRRPTRTPTWLGEVDTARENFRKMVRERAEKVRGELPIHPDRLIGDLVSVLDKDATIVVDSFTLSGYISHHWTVRFPGQIVDAGPLAPVGHGIGMAIGAQLARPGKQVITVIGDGGIGIGGWDMETAAKYNIPIIALLWNNSSWGPSFEQMPMLKGRTDPFDMLPGIRYDRIFQELGCHGEHVETARRNRSGACAGFESRQAGRDQRRRRQAHRPSHAGRQSAGFDAGMTGSGMRVIMMGTGPFAVPDVSGNLRFAARSAGPVHAARSSAEGPHQDAAESDAALAIEHGTPVHDPESINSTHARMVLASYQAGSATSCATTARFSNPSAGDRAAGRHQSARFAAAEVSRGGADQLGPLSRRNGNRRDRDSHDAAARRRAGHRARPDGNWSLRHGGGNRTAIGRARCAAGAGGDGGARSRDRQVDRAGPGTATKRRD